MFTLDTWIVSDTHFGHDNIVKYCGRPTNHDYIIADRWRRLVKPSDTLLHLGDLTVWFGIKRPFWELIASYLPGQKFLILGNHDTHRHSEYQRMGFHVLDPFDSIFKLDKDRRIRIHFSHDPQRERWGLWDYNIHGHVHNNNHRDADSLEDYNLNASIEEWDYRPVRLQEILKRYNLR